MSDCAFRRDGTFVALPEPEPPVLEEAWRRAEVELVSDRVDGPYAGVHRMPALEFLALGGSRAGALRGAGALRAGVRDAAAAQRAIAACPEGWPGRSELSLGPTPNSETHTRRTER